MTGVLDMPKRQPIEVEAEDEETAHIRINPKLREMIVAVVNWKKIQPNAKIKTAAQYIEVLLRDPVAEDFRAMADAIAAQAARLSSRK